MRRSISAFLIRQQIVSVNPGLVLLVNNFELEPMLSISPDFVHTFPDVMSTHGLENLANCRVSQISDVERSIS